MISFKGCSIHLDQLSKKYFPGQILTGNVLINFDEPKVIKGIQIGFLGEAHTSWSESSSSTDSQGNSTNESTTYSGKEEYFRVLNYLIGGKFNEELTLGIGSHTFPFSFTLPLNIPTSFEGAHGYIRYTITIILHRKGILNKSTFIKYEVVSNLNSNVDLNLKEPFRMEVEKTFCCCCCKSGPLSLVASVSHRIFKIGNFIPFIVECDNGSNITVKNVTVTLNKVVIYRVNFPRTDKKTHKTKINEITLEGVIVHNSKTWSNKIEIPEMELPDLSDCTIIDLDYELEIKANVSGAHVDLIGVIPLTIIANDQIRGPTGFNYNQNLDTRKISVGENKSHFSGQITNYPLKSFQP